MTIVISVANLLCVIIIIIYRTRYVHMHLQGSLSNRRFVVNLLHGGRDLEVKGDTPVELLVSFGLLRLSVWVWEVCVTMCVCNWLSERRGVVVEHIETPEKV